MRFHHRKKAPHPIENGCLRDVRTSLKYDDPGGMLGRETPYLAEIAIHRNEHSLFFGANTEQRIVGASAEVLTAHRCHVMPCGLEQILSAASDVFVELEFHASLVTGTGTMRSRVTSAP